MPQRSSADGRFRTRARPVAARQPGQCAPRRSAPVPAPSVEDARSVPILFVFCKCSFLPAGRRPKRQVAYGPAGSTNRDIERKVVDAELADELVGDDAADGGTDAGRNLDRIVVHPPAVGDVAVMLRDLEIVDRV